METGILIAKFVFGLMCLPIVLVVGHFLFGLVLWPLILFSAIFPTGEKRPVGETWLSEVQSAFLYPYTRAVIFFRDWDRYQLLISIVGIAGMTVIGTIEGWW